MFFASCEPSVDVPESELLRSPGAVSHQPTTPLRSLRFTNMGSLVQVAEGTLSNLTPHEMQMTHAFLAKTGFAEVATHCGNTVFKNAQGVAEVTRLCLKDAPVTMLSIPWDDASTKRSGPVSPAELSERNGQLKELVCQLNYKVDARRVLDPLLCDCRAFEFWVRLPRTVRGVNSRGNSAPNTCMLSQL